MIRILLSKRRIGIKMIIWFETAKHKRSHPYDKRGPFSYFRTQAKCPRRMSRSWNTGHSQLPLNSGTAQNEWNSWTAYRFSVAWLLEGYLGDPFSGLFSSESRPTLPTLRPPWHRFKMHQLPADRARAVVLAIPFYLPTNLGLYSICNEHW